MKYTYNAYSSLIDCLIKHGYTPIPFSDACNLTTKPAIIRHDVDVDPIIASRFGYFEKEMGIRSTYFVMLSSSYYNLLSRKCRLAVEKLLKYDHELGLHFDMTNYECKSIDEVIEKIRNEKSVLEKTFEITVKSLSWHIPVKTLINRHLPQLEQIGLLNAYDPEYYSGYKYVSDSMMKWREPIEEYIQMEQFDKLQILTHPIWYKEKQDATSFEILKENYQSKSLDVEEYLETIVPGFMKKLKA